MVRPIGNDRFNVLQKYGGNDETVALYRREPGTFDQKCTERRFAEFIIQAPAAAVADNDLKRHYQEPGPLKTPRRLAPQGTAQLEPESLLGLAS